MGYSFRLAARLFYMHRPTDRIAHTTAFVTPVVEHWLEQQITYFDGHIYIMFYWRGCKGIMCPPTFLLGGGGGKWYVLTPHFYFPLELYVYITLTINYLSSFIYQLIIYFTSRLYWLFTEGT